MFGNIWVYVSIYDQSVLSPFTKPKKIVEMRVIYIYIIYIYVEIRGGKTPDTDDPDFIFAVFAKTMSVHRRVTFRKCRVGSSIHCGYLCKLSTHFKSYLLGQI